MSPNGLKLFASPWAPPEWMKDNHKFNESGALVGPVGGRYYQTWAQYFVRFFEEYAKHNISFWGLTVENEPVQGMMNKKHPFNCLNMSAQTEAEFIAENLGPTLAKAGYGSHRLKLMVFDDSAQQMEEYATASRADNQSQQYVSGVAYHWYANSVKKHDFPDKVLDRMHDLFPNWFVINSEACHLQGLGFGSWDYGERYAFDIIRV